MILGGTTCELVALVERLQGILDRAPASDRLGDVFGQTYTRTRQPMRYRTAVVERATADETCGKAAALELAYERVNDTFVHTTVGFKIQHLVEAARASYYSACNAVDRCAVTGDTREVSASDSLREEQRAEEHSELQAQIAREHREMATRSVEGDLESWSGGSD